MSVWAQIMPARELVAAMADLQIGTWSKDAPRQWIREEPPCPIAEAADQGKPHRYRLEDVLTWLRNRALRERAKGFTRGDGNSLVDRIDRALAERPERGSATETAPQAGYEAKKSAANTSAPAGGGAASAKEPQQDWTLLGDVEALLEVLRGRDPRNWKAAEEALEVRRKRRVEEGKLMPVGEFESALHDQITVTLAAINAMPQALKLALRDHLKADSQDLLDGILAAEIDRLCERLASDSDLAGSTESQSAPDRFEPSPGRRDEVYEEGVKWLNTL